nr:MAG TPA: hypothetical protein [Caudoviricetes sp.]
MRGTEGGNGFQQKQAGHQVSYPARPGPAFAIVTHRRTPPL